MPIAARARRAVLVGGLVLLGALWVAPAAGAAPTTTTTLPPLPATQRNSQGICTVKGGTEASSIAPGSPPLTVSASTDGVVALWLPGLDWSQCQAAHGYGGPAAARALASAIDLAPVVKPGAVYHCPMDDGTAARLSFEGPHGGVTVVVDVELSGCRFVTAKGRAARMWTKRLRTALLLLAPTAWQVYLGVTT